MSIITVIQQALSGKIGFLTQGAFEGWVSTVNRNATVLNRKESFRSSVKKAYD